MNLDTPDMTVPYCPLCEPDLDPTKTMVTTRFCSQHQPTRDGVDDDAVRSSREYISGNADAGGDDNRRFCELLHGGARR